jgi:hypothetical protein
MSEPKQHWLPGWKVVYRGYREGNLWSCTNLCRGRSVRYVESEAVQPQRGMGPLTIFKTWAEAHEFQGIHFSMFHTTYAIRKCAYVQSEHKAVWDGSRFFETNRLPAGTALADAVMLWPQAKDSKP